MEDQTFKVIELAGASRKSIDDAIRQALGRAAATLSGLSWLQVTEIRGRIEPDQTLQYQVIIKVGFEIQPH